MDWAGRSIETCGMLSSGSQIRMHIIFGLFIFPSIFRLKLWNNLLAERSHWLCGLFCCTWDSSTSIYRCWITVAMAMDSTVRHSNRNWLEILCITRRCHGKWRTVQCWLWKISKQAAAICIRIIICTRKEWAPGNNRCVSLHHFLIWFVVFKLD